MEGRKGGCAMSFLREKRARFYFLFLCGIALVLLLFSILMTWQHTRQTQELLLEKKPLLLPLFWSKEFPRKLSQQP